MKKKTSKYNIDQTERGKQQRTHNNILFDSKLECDYYKFLLQQKAEGLVESIELQPRFLLFDGYVRKKDNKKVLPVYYKSDFKITYSDGTIKIIDTKGHSDSLGLLKRKLMEGIYPDIDFQWISYSKVDNGWIDYDLLVEARRKRKKAKSKGKILKL